MPDNPPFISVVVPTCERPTTLKVLIDSLAACCYSKDSYEIIVVDQSSSNGKRGQTEKICSLIDNLIYIHSDIKCSSDSRNRGWERAKGKIIAFTDDDAIVDSQWLNALADAFGKHKKNVGIVGGRIVPLFKGKKPDWLPPEREYLLPSFNYDGEMRPFPENSLPISVNLAIWRSLFKELGGFNTKLGLKNDAEIPYIGGEDTYLGMKVREAGYHIIYQPEAIVYHPVTSWRLKKKFFLIRNFREGTTCMALESVKERCTEKVLAKHTSWHFKRACFLVLLLIKDFIIPKKGRAKAYMLCASKIAFSLGVIKYSQFLKKSQICHYSLGKKNQR
jgi:GT2 family glycosyltransferase